MTAGGFPAGLLARRPLRAVWSGQVRGCESGQGGRRMVVRNGRGRAGGFPATPSSTHRLQIREARKNFLCCAQKPCRLRGFAAARVLPGV